MVLRKHAGLILRHPSQWVGEGVAHRETLFCFKTLPKKRDISYNFDHQANSYFPPVFQRGTPDAQFG
jgi:hypothetical protein